MLVYSDDRQKDYRLKDCNGWEIYRIDYSNGMRRYQVWSQTKKSENSLGCLDFFHTLKEARAFARAN